jgi:hypothetical protein
MMNHSKSARGPTGLGCESRHHFEILRSGFWKSPGLARLHPPLE